MVAYPTNEVNFVIEIELKHEAGHHLKIQYDWIAVNNDDFEFKDFETATLKEWTLLQIEGEDPQPVVEV